MQLLFLHSLHLHAERQHSYRHWTDESMKCAYSRVMDNELSLREASTRYGVPYSTLCDRVSGRTRFDSHSGPPRYLTDVEEAESSWTEECSGSPTKSETHAQLVPSLMKKDLEQRGTITNTAHIFGPCMLHLITHSRSLIHHAGACWERGDGQWAGDTDQRESSSREKEGALSTASITRAQPHLHQDILNAGTPLLTGRRS